VVDCLRDKGAVFVEELSEIPDDATVIFSAHGVSKAVQKEATQRGLKVFDATCPLVTKVHMEVTRFSNDGMECILIGHDGHPEVEGTMGQFDPTAGGKMYLVETVDDVESLSIKDEDHLSYVTQTTLSMDDTAAIIDALKNRFPHINGPKKDDICYATQNRQDAVKQMAVECDVLFVVGSPNSSNSNRLKEVAERLGTPAYLIENETHIKKEWLENKNKVGLTAGASAPEVLVQNVIKKLQGWGMNVSRELKTTEENIEFSLPKALQSK